MEQEDEMRLTVRIYLTSGGKLHYTDETNIAYVTMRALLNIRDMYME